MTSTLEILDEQLPVRRSKERWGRGLTVEEKANLAAVFIKRTCGKCGSFWSGSFLETGQAWAKHQKAGCR